MLMIARRQSMVGPVALKSYRDLDVWQQSMGLAETVWRLSALFPAEERFGMTSQLRRAATSVPANIAEGAERHGTREFLQVLGHRKRLVGGDRNLSPLGGASRTPPFQPREGHARAGGDRRAPAPRPQAFPPREDSRWTVGADAPLLLTDHRPPTTDHRPPTIDHRPPTTDHRPPTTRTAHAARAARRPAPRPPPPARPTTPALTRRPRRRHDPVSR